MNINRALFIFFYFFMLCSLYYYSRAIVMDDFNFYDSKVWVLSYGNQFSEKFFPIQILEAFGGPVGTWTKVYGLYMFLHNLARYCVIYFNFSILTITIANVSFGFGMVRYSRPPWPWRMGLLLAYCSKALWWRWCIQSPERRKMLLAQHFYSPVHEAARVLALKEANCPALPARGKELHWWPLEGGGLGIE